MSFVALHSAIEPRSSAAVWSDNVVEERRLTAPSRLIAALAALLLAANAPARSGTVALTFDDLPVFGSFTSAADGGLVTDQLLGALTRHHWRVTGFVNEVQLEGSDKPQRIALLERWLDAGMDLGNHTYSHLSLNTTPVEAYVADIARDEAETSRLLAARGRHERWFRYPYLETGQTRASHDRVARWLAKHDYRIAPVTMENSDWQFSAPYDDAVAHGDAAAASRIRQQYLTFTRAIVFWYANAGTTLFGREPAFVFLLHASRLNAASIDALAAILRDARLRVVPLGVAMRDPAYRTTDGYIGPDGNEWLERWAQTLHRGLRFETIPRVPANIVALDDRLEAAVDPHATPPAPEGGAPR